MKLKKTLEKIGAELGFLVDEYKKELEAAYVKNGLELLVSFKLKIAEKDGKIELKPSMEFYPEPKLKTEPYTVKIDEHQKELPFKSDIQIVK